MATSIIPNCVPTELLDNITNTSSDFILFTKSWHNWCKTNTAFLQTQQPSHCQTNIAKAPFSKHNAIKIFYYHDCINNIHAVATECLNRLPSRHICLRHYQLDVLCVNSRLINLDHTHQVVLTTVQIIYRSS